MFERCFAFGCSFTHWYYWPTWADFVAVNSENYYNFGNPGLSNKTILNRFLEVDSLMNFTTRDLILVGITNIGRHNWLEEKDMKPVWFCHGGPENWPDTEKANFIRNNLWKHQWGIYDSWLTVKTITKLLNHRGIKHLMIMAMDNNHWKHFFRLDNKENDMLDDILTVCGQCSSLQEFSLTYPKVKDDNHPNIDAHYEYIENYYPEYITDKSVYLRKESNKIFNIELYSNRDGIDIQNEKHQRLMQTLLPNLASQVDVYGKFI